MSVLTKLSALAASFALLSLVAADDRCVDVLDKPYTELCGTASGDFELLGSLCFPGGTNGENEIAQISFTLEFKDVGTSPTSVLPQADLDNYKILFYDDQASSFASINRITDDGDAQTCSERESFSREICAGSSCTYGLSISDSTTTSGTTTTYSKSISISEAYAREWYFVLSACDITSPIKLHSYNVSSSVATDCLDLYSNNDTGYIAAIAILTLVLVGLVATAYIFYKRTKIPELLSMDDTGYNEL